jgi:hypothetical protein
MRHVTPIARNGAVTPAGPHGAVSRATVSSTSPARLPVGPGTTVGSFLSLQRSVGNRVVSRMLTTGSLQRASAADDPMINDFWGVKSALGLGDQGGKNLDKATDMAWNFATGLPGVGTAAAGVAYGIDTYKEDAAKDAGDANAQERFAHDKNTDIVSAIPGVGTATSIGGIMYDIMSDETSGDLSHDLQGGYSDPSAKGPDPEAGGGWNPGGASPAPTPAPAPGDASPTPTPTPAPAPGDYSTPNPDEQTG